MAIIKQYHKETGITYVYESVSYWDPEKKQSRSKRKMIGKIDPETGDIIPTGKIGRPKKETDNNKHQEFADSNLASLYEQSRSRIKNLELLLSEKQAELDELNRKHKRLVDIVSKIDSQYEKNREMYRDLI